MRSQPAFNYDERPFLVIWETTHACDLACVHCRADAEPTPKPDELSHEEALRLIDDVKDLGAPILVFSGGDCLKRLDIAELIQYAKSKKLRTGAVPAVTPLLTSQKILELKKAGLDQMAFSLDAATASEHDAFRRVSGVFDRTLEAVRVAREAGLAVQINSLINLHNLVSMDSLTDLMERLGIVFWEVFFLVPVGRGIELKLLEAEKFEEAFEKIYQLQQRVKFIIKVTEAPHYRRFCIEKEMKKEGILPEDAIRKGIDLPHYLRRSAGPGGSIGMAPQGVNSGKGFIFIAYNGLVYPSGFLPIEAGSLRKESLKDIYQNSKLLRDMRNPDLLHGRCGICAYRMICGGSRSRAYAMSGDYLAEDPGCIYQPPPL